MIKYLTPRSEEEINTYLTAVTLKDLIFSMSNDCMKKELRRRLRIIDIKLVNICFKHEIVPHIYLSDVNYYTIMMQMRGYNRKYMFDILKKEGMRYELEDEESDGYNDYTKDVYKLTIRIYK